MACLATITQGPRGLPEHPAIRDPAENRAPQEGMVSLEVQVHPAHRGREVQQDRKVTEDHQEWEPKDHKGLQVHQDRAEQDLQALQAPLGPAAPLDVQATLESVGLLGLLDTATLLSVSVSLTTGKDTQVHHSILSRACAAFTDFQKNTKLN